MLPSKPQCGMQDGTNVGLRSNKLILLMHENRIIANLDKEGLITVRFNNIETTSKTLGRRCINVIQMFCVYWE